MSAATDLRDLLCADGSIDPDDVEVDGADALDLFDDGDEGYIIGAVHGLGGWHVRLFSAEGDPIGPPVAADTTETAADLMPKMLREVAS